MSEPEEYRDRPISIAAGEDYFSRTGVGDPYATGIAYPIFLALMELYPDDVGRDWRDFAARFGLVFAPGASTESKALPAGFHLTIDPFTNVPFVVMSCHLCHADVLKLPSGDRFVSGIGSKRVRVHAYDAAMMRIGSDASFTAERLAPIAASAAAKAGVMWPDAWRAKILEATLREWKRRAGIRIADTKKLERGLPGRVATIESFMMAMNTQLGTHLALPARTGWTKIPDVRGFRYRETLSYDGAGTGAPNVLAAEADFAFGARPAWYDAHRHIGTSLFLFLRAFDRDLAFPGAIDRELAARGRVVFDAKCAPCHGAYSGEPGKHRASYDERVVPLSMVATDDARLRAMTAELVDAANAVPITRGVAHVAATEGYVPPVLIDLWARGSYGHAGQWPTLDVLAMKPEDRPRTVVVATDAPYDLDRIGARWRPSSPMDDAKLAPGDYVYDASVPGYGVGGHPFLSDLPAADRRAVLEYAKLL
jgi:mono/diheme cytochrome c family protein